MEDTHQAPLATSPGKRGLITSYYPWVQQGDLERASGQEGGRTTVTYSTRGSKAVTPGPAVLSLLVLCFFLLWD